MPITYGSILIVDSDESRRIELARSLQRDDWYAVTIAKAIPMALALLRKRTFEVILMDATLATEDDFGALREFHEATGRTPIIVLVTGKNFEIVTRCLECGASDYLLEPTNPTLLKAKINNTLEKYELRAQLRSFLGAFYEVKQLADDLRELVLPLGNVLSAETNFQSLLDRIVTEALTICHADAGRLYLRTRNELHLYSHLVHSLELHEHDNGEGPGNETAIPLYDDAGKENHRHIAAHVAHVGEAVSIADVYAVDEFDFNSLQAFDRRYNYRSVSCLTIPLANPDIVGVLQLLNAQDENGSIIAFTNYLKLVMESVANQAALVLHNHILRQRHEELLRHERELRIARDIQAGFFPKKLPLPPGWELAAKIEPAREVGGDFYDAIPLPNNKVGLVIADVCGKSVVAALFMALVRSLIRAYIQQFYYHLRQRIVTDSEEMSVGNLSSHETDVRGLYDAIVLTNAYIGRNHYQEHMFTTLFLGVLNPKNGRLTYINCGHNPPLIFNDRAIKQELAPTGPAVGISSDAVFEVAETWLDPGDVLLAYTDGVTEARDVNGRFFTQKRLRALLCPHAASASALQDEIHRQVRRHIGGAASTDDVTTLIVRRQTNHNPKPAHENQV